ncbi:sensor histidine kinase [Paenibacillus eucommiae]|uniref:histidine kinase n=1 Tax=Paenibacillus eucommiae TaxID=1355755 RepID=A0ABS4ISI6_9BACL|nr:histidine kinase [Paenibacillus eucommiae]MBP1989846.1 signal transduction histidine kinase [Paenibacillus eucommiae]
MKWMTKWMMEPMRFVNGWRLLNICVLIHLWIMLETKISSFILILLLLVMMSLRWRYSIPVWTVVFDALVCLMYVPYTDFSVYGLALPIFELALSGRWAIALLFFSGIFLTSASPGLLFWNFLQACFFGCFAYMTLKNQEAYKQEADEQRKARYELERIKIDLLEANQTASHQAELMERYRISRELHDHLGHDLTGANLALQAYEYVQEPKEAQKLLQEIKNRLERSTKNLRETVHNMTSMTFIGVENLEHIVQNYQQIHIQFLKSGDMQLVAAHQWGLLEACLKEALTNVARHSNATKVEVDLQVTASIVRLSIRDHGTVNKMNPAGTGLRSLQMRARSLGGSLSFSQENGFLLVCVIPLEKEALMDETINRR